MSEPTDANGFRLNPQRPRAVHNPRNADDSGWFHESDAGIDVFIGKQSDTNPSGLRFVRIPPKALRRWAETDRKHREDSPDDN